MSLCLAHTSRSVGNRPKYELADILKRYLPRFRKTHRISRWQEKILYDIQICRTVSCGAHIEICTHCEYRQPAYNSCHNRHCPKCQGIARRKWVESRLKELLPVPYYHIVFTLPHRLNDLALYNKELIYNLFYQAAAYTLLKFGKDPKYLGAQLGFIGVLHTWGKGLCYHVHWHFIVPGGGLTESGQWINLPCSDKFIFPSLAMSKVIKARFIKQLRKLYNKKQLNIPDNCEYLNSPVMFEYFLNDLASDQWINYAKKPFGGPEQAVKYIGRYTHRVAIANNRLLDINSGKISFEVKNYKKGGIKEAVRLSADEFIRRFLLHILPKRFRKIRYGGFLARSVSDKKIEQARSQLVTEATESRINEIELVSNGWDIKATDRCPKCQIGIMRAIDIDKNAKVRNWHAYIGCS
ncbi:MAG: IS91 family transposase [bacterium]|nr:IS91 family transposase [bacterium]